MYMLTTSVICLVVTIKPVDASVVVAASVAWVTSTTTGGITSTSLGVTKRVRLRIIS